MGIIPRGVAGVAETLQKGGFQAYLVGGCVRDLLIGREPKDWDITTDARPEEVLIMFPDSVYENNFGTVGVKIRRDNDNDDSTTKVVEVTTFRKEGKYTDARHPDEIKFAETIEEDLRRRDFTINAIALSVNPKHEARSTKQIQNSKSKNKNVLEFKNSDLDIVSDFGFRISGLTDPYDGQKDLKNRVIRTVGNPDERFKEDALRLMRAVRFAAELGFEIEEKTAAAIVKHAELLQMIAKERVRDELVKIILSSADPKLRMYPNLQMATNSIFVTGAGRGIQMLEDLGLLKYIMPELREGIGCGQNKHHIYSVWEHNLRALDYAAGKNYSLEVRLASLFHDVGKPRTKRGEGTDSTFYGHEVVGAKMTAQILERLKFPKDVIEKVVHLVRHHLFYYNVGEVSPAGVRRFLARVGVDSIDDLIRVREADRIGSGVPKAVPYKLRHLLFMIDKVRRDPTSPKMLAVKGGDVMEVAGIPPGPKVGWIIAALMDEVLDDPKKNDAKDLRLRIKEIGKLSDEELQELAKKGKDKIMEAEEEAEGEIKKRHRV